MPLKDACLPAIGSRLAVDLHKMIGNLRRERILVTQSATYRARCQISSVSLMYGPRRVAGERTYAAVSGITERMRKIGCNLFLSLSLPLSLSLLAYQRKQIIIPSLYSISRDARLRPGFTRASRDIVNTLILHRELTSRTRTAAR